MSGVESTIDNIYKIEEQHGRSDVPNELRALYVRAENAESELEKVRERHVVSFARHTHRISVLAMYGVFVLFVVLILWLIYYTILASVSMKYSVDNIWYGVLVSFLSGALGAGLGDKIFSRIKNTGTPSNHTPQMSSVPQDLAQHVWTAQALKPRQH